MTSYEGLSEKLVEVLEHHEKLWSTNWQHKLAILKSAILTSQSALETAKAFMIQQSVAAADTDHFEHPITEINKALDIIEQLNLLKK